MAQSEIEAAPMASSAGFLSESRTEPVQEIESETFAIYDRGGEAEETMLVEEETLVRATAEDGPPVGDVLAILNDAVEGGRVDLYLQPIVTLPERKLRYYEGFTRLRTHSDEVVLPRDYLPIAERERPDADHRQRAAGQERAAAQAASLRIRASRACSATSRSSRLLDPDFFPELVEFMEENSGLSESLVFEVSQPAIVGLTRGELSCFDTLGALGFGFSLDHVGDLDVDFAGLRDRSFRFVKIDAKTFLHDMKEKGAALPAADMKAYLESFDLKLIVEKVEDEADVGKLIDYGVELGEGYLFGEPKAMSPQLVRELESADAA